MNGETDCILVSHFQNRSRRFNRLNPVLPADAAMRLDAEDELYGKIEDLCYHMLLPRCDANAHYVEIWVGPGHTLRPRGGSLTRKADTIVAQSWTINSWT